MGINLRTATRLLTVKAAGMAQTSARVRASFGSAIPGELSRLNAMKITIPKMIRLTNSQIRTAIKRRHKNCGRLTG